MGDKRYYWIKLKTEFFNQDTIDFLLSQNNGCEYVVLYQMLCLKTANNNGQLSTNIGEMIVPYDIEKIARDTKYFSEDTIRVALELYKQLGLIYEGDDNLLQITNYYEMIGSESASREAIKKREYRLRKKIEDIEGDKKGTKCLTEYRDKSIDIRDIDINNIKENTKRKVFTKPTIEEIEVYCKERNNSVNAEAFFNFYESKDWYVGKNKMKDWKACVRTWEQRQPKDTKPNWLNKEIKTETMEVEITDEDRKRFGIS